MSDPLNSAALEEKNAGAEAKSAMWFHPHDLEDKDKSKSGEHAFEMLQSSQSVDTASFGLA